MRTHTWSLHLYKDIIKALEIKLAPVIGFLWTQGHVMTEQLIKAQTHNKCNYFRAMKYFPSNFLLMLLSDMHCALKCGYECEIWNCPCKTPSNLKVAHLWWHRYQYRSLIALTNTFTLADQLTLKLPFPSYNANTISPALFLNYKRSFTVSELVFDGKQVTFPRRALHRRRHYSRERSAHSFLSSLRDTNATKYYKHGRIT